MINLYLESALGLFQFLLVILILVALFLGAILLGIYRSMTISRKIKIGTREDQFKDFLNPKLTKRIRLLALIALSSWFVLLLVIGLVFVMGREFVDYKIVFTLFILFGLISSLAVFFIYREILRRIAE